MKNDKEQFNLVVELAKMQENQLQKYNIHVVTIQKPKDNEQVDN